MKTSFALLVALLGLAQTASAQQAPDGAATFNRACATCHREGQNTAPTPTVLRQLSPEGIVNSLTNGRMQVQGASLSDAERRAIAQFLTGRAPAAVTATAVVNKCTASPAMSDAATTPGWNGWGNGVANTVKAAFEARGIL